MLGMKLDQQLRRAVECSGLTRYAVAKGAGVDYDALARFLDQGRDIRLSTVQALAEFFGMKLTPPKKPARHG